MGSMTGSTTTTSTTTARRPAASHPVVLWVDDEPLLRESGARLLRRLGVEVVTAGNGQEALELLAAGARPDLILTDLCMPLLDGEALLRSIRAQPSLAEVPVVAVSGRPTDARFDLYLAKPFGIEEVRGVLRRFCPVRPVERCA